MIKTVNLETVPAVIMSGHTVIKKKLIELALLFNSYDIFRQRQIAKDRAEQRRKDADQKYVDDCKYLDKAFGLNTV